MVKLLFSSLMMIASFLGLSQVNMPCNSNAASVEMEYLMSQCKMQDGESSANVNLKAQVYWSYLVQLNQSGKGDAVTGIYEGLFAESLKEHNMSAMKQNVETFEKSFSQYVQPAREYGQKTLNIQWN